MLMSQRNVLSLYCQRKMNTLCMSRTIGNVGNNIRLILDVTVYTDVNNIPGAMLLLDIEKAFDCVSHKFLFQVLKH